MPVDPLIINRGAVFLGAVVYWGGVLIQTRRVRRHIGRSPNAGPRGPKEQILWAGWLFVIAAWIFQPIVAGVGAPWFWLRLFPSLLVLGCLVSGLLLTVLGYAGTLWCYSAMGDSWRMGVNRQERNALVTGGPYRWVRHPIYLFQVIMLAGVIFLLPSPLAVLAFCLHLSCVLVKVSDEEAYLGGLHGQVYEAYAQRTGKLFPRFRPL
jgi:protein-S-isoprenylcysteine O-methyltransferase Ste14